MTSTRAHADQAQSDLLMACKLCKCVQMRKEHAEQLKQQATRLLRYTLCTHLMMACRASLLAASQDLPTLCGAHALVRISSISEHRVPPCGTSSESFSEPCTTCIAAATPVKSDLRTTTTIDTTSKVNRTTLMLRSHTTRPAPPAAHLRVCDS